MPEFSDYIEGLPAAASLDGSEIVGVSQAGGARKTTTQDIADLGGGGGGSQDLQSVLDEGAIATLSGPLTITGVQDVALGTSLNKLNTVGIFSAAGTNISTNDGAGVTSSLIATSAQASMIFDNSTNENTIDLNGNINMSTVGPSFHTAIDMEDGSVAIATADNGNTQLARIEVSDGIKIDDTFANRGIQGLADYSANIQANDYTQKVYVDGLLVGLWDDRGSFDASVNAYPSSGGSGSAGAILKGDIWTVSVVGTLPTGQAVEVGDTVRALVDTPGNTQANWAILQNNIGYVPAPIASPTLTGVPAAPTAAGGTNTTQIATTAFVQQEIGAVNGITKIYAQQNFK